MCTHIQAKVVNVIRERATLVLGSEKVVAIFDPRHVSIRDQTSINANVCPVRGSGRESIFYIFSCDLVPEAAVATTSANSNSESEEGCPLIPYNFEDDELICPISQLGKRPGAPFIKARVEEYRSGAYGVNACGFILRMTLMDGSGTCSAVAFEAVGRRIEKALSRLQDPAKIVVRGGRLKRKERVAETAENYINFELVLTASTEIFIV